MILASFFSDDNLLVFLAGLLLLALFFWYFTTETFRKKRNIGSIIVFLITLFSILAIIPRSQWIPLLSGKKTLTQSHSLQGGIDLLGGSSFTLRVQPNKDAKGNPIPLSQEAINQAIGTVRKRLNNMGAKDLQIVSQGEDRILVLMPGVSPQEATNVRNILQEIAKLEIRIVHPNNSSLAPQVDKNPEERVPGYRLYIYEDTRKGEPFREPLLLKNRITLDGSYIESAQENYGAYAGSLSVTLNSKGADRMLKATQQMTLNKDRLAIVLDGKVLSAPTVQAVLSKQFQITGMENVEEARKLASALLNPLKNPLIVEEERTVSATLGKETISQGVRAGIAGLLLTFILLLVYYRLAGLISLIGLALNVLVLFGSMAMFGFTFTLPGIAGIVLTIGIAVDANVLIYERLREERASGKSLRAALDAAYQKAFSAIFDANITTLLTAIILFWMASGTVRGFAITLTIGILASMLAALLFTRIMFWWATDYKLIKRLSFMDLIHSEKFDFLSRRNICFILSSLLIIGSFLIVGVKQKSALSIDFTGGSMLSYQLDGDQRVAQPEVSAYLSTLSLSKPAISQEEITADGKELLSVRCARQDTNRVESALAQKFPLLKSKPSRSSISATLGGEFLRKSGLSLLLGLVVILIYIAIRFELSFAVAAFCALLHDIIIVLGIIIATGQQISLIHVGAFLTIAGYSINDTIVVFDRIREDLTLSRGNLKDIMNRAINTTLSRTILTSTTTFIAVAVLYFFGGASLKDFSFTIMAGVLVGTYSSIFIASPIVYIWTKMRGGNLRREVLDANLAKQIIPGQNA